MCNRWSFVSYHGRYLYDQNGKWHCQTQKSFLLQALCGWYHQSKKNRKWRQLFKIVKCLSPKSKLHWINPNKFLDTNIHVNSHGDWSSRISKRYKRNSIIISPKENFWWCWGRRLKISLVKQTTRIVSSKKLSTSLRKKKRNPMKDESTLIPPSFLEEKRQFLLMDEFGLTSHVFTYQSPCGFGGKIKTNHSASQAKFCKN